MRRTLTLSILALLLTGCTNDVNYRGTVVDDSKTTESVVKALRSKYPIPQPTESAELANLAKRIERLAKQNRLAYVYLLSSDGHVVASWVINGKVSSLNSLFTAPQQFSGIQAGGSYHIETMPSPDLDGSYGENPSGSFWFDTKDLMTEVILGGGMVVCTETPMRINTPISLTAILDPEARKRADKEAREHGTVPGAAEAATKPRGN